jgi:uncharacterized protein YndB with AHSA1/START domain
MTVTNVHKDPKALTMALTSALDGPPETVWRLIAEPRLLERWWGPPGWPATFEDCTLTPGERSTMVVTASFPTAEAMEQVLAMGMEEGARAGAEQIDAVLADIMAAEGAR